MTHSKTQQPVEQQIHTIRYPFVDVMRGIALLCMAIYHFCFDLNMYGVIHQQMNNNLFWLTARACIVTAFLSLVGISIVLAQHQMQLQKNYAHRWRRLFQLVCAALTVTIASWCMFPESYIFFGVLHAIIVMSLIGMGMQRFYWLNLGIGLLVILLGVSYSHPLFDQPLLQWVGLMTFKPFTEDYVPLFPWLGVVLVGIFIAKWCFAHPKNWLLHQQILRSDIKWLAALGRHSLLFYMLHQPILLGLLWLMTSFLMPNNSV